MRGEKKHEGWEERGRENGDDRPSRADGSREGRKRRHII